VRLSGSGLAIGVVAALGLSRTLSAFLFGVQPHDVATFGIVTVVLVLVSALASVQPARRASAIDPILVLKAE
jgi:ABC-type antimicrobial peptide transport system permease subunit